LNGGQRRVERVIEVVGIGAGGWESLGPAEQRLLSSADLVIGGPRQLGLLPAVSGQRREVWPTDLRAALPELVSGHAEDSTVVLASGDPLLAGVGSTLVELFGASAVRVHPVVSSVALARARMGWAAETTEIIRLRGDDVDQVRRWLFPGQRLIILSRDSRSPAEVADLLSQAGHPGSTLTVLGNLGGANETRRTDPTDAPDLNVVCVEVAGPAPWATLAAGRIDEAYEHDGQLTKRDVRASALAHLMPRPGELLWDVGAGAGSIGIEWSLSHPRCRAVAIERDHDRVKRIAANATQLGVPGLVVVHGTAPAALHDLPRPDAVFVGGGATAEVLDTCWSALAPAGRLVVHAVTMETEMIITERWQRWGGELTRIAVEHLERLGAYHGWKPTRPVVQWSVSKPAEP
jgi:precorrin-6Y C5,15-methyltransferase (decarboxylating)